MKRSIRMGLVAIVALSALSSMPAQAACSYSGSALTSGAPKVDQVDDGQVDTYKIEVKANQVAEILLQAANGDIDMRVCNTANGAEVCYSHNQYPIADGCIDEGTETDIQDVGPQLSPGKYRITINACWSSKDGDNCDYADPFGDGSGAPGALDPLPAVQYVLSATII